MNLTQPRVAVNTPPMIRPITNLVFLVQRSAYVEVSSTTCLPNCSCCTVTRHRSMLFSSRKVGTDHTDGRRYSRSSSQPYDTRMDFSDCVSRMRTLDHLPCNARKMIALISFCANDTASDQMVSHAMPVQKVNRLPKRSATTL